MKKITKDDKGITIIGLVLTVIIMLILLSVTTYTGMDVYKESKVTKFVAQMQLIQLKVDTIKNEKTIEELQELGTEISGKQINIINEAFSNNEISSNDTNAYRYFTRNELQEMFDIDNVNDDVMINFETREIVSLNGTEYKEKKYYTQYRLPNGETLINRDEDELRLLNFNFETVIDGLNCTLTINDVSITNGTIKFASINEVGAQGEWKTITNYSERGIPCTINVSESGNYIFRIEDNTNSENYLEKTMTIKLTNKPKTNLEVDEYNYSSDSSMWAYLQKDDTYYVWIPRFAYKKDNNNIIKFIKGNSNIATDNSYIDKNEWETPEKFNQENGIELTGIWVEVNSEKESGLDIIELINSNAETLINI